MDRKRLTLVACVLASAIVLIDTTVVNVALPTIQADLGGGLSSQQWLINAYLLALSSLLLIGGSLGDVLGERRVFVAGVAAFGVTSLLCTAAPSIDFLIAARALQGVAGALLVPGALAVIVTTFPDAERGRAIGTWTAWSGIATVIGPLVGGQLVDSASWRLIFAVNVPFVVVALVLIVIAVPGRDDAPRTRRIDVVGAALCAMGLGGPVFGLIAEPANGWASPSVWGPLVVGLTVLAVFLAW